MATVTAAFSSPTTDSIVSLRDVTRESVRDVCRLKVKPEQESFVAPNAVSIAQAYFHPEAWFCAIYIGETPVGFAMLEDWSQCPDIAPDEYHQNQYVALWRFMIDARYQSRGYGAVALGLLIEQARTRPGAKVMYLSFVPGEGNAETFYRRFGFLPTGEEDEGEIVMMRLLG